MNQKRIKNLFKSEYLGNISIQVFGTGIAQVIPLLLMPILSRIYDKEAFAVYASFMAVIAVLSVATGARYQYAIVLPKDKIDAVNVFKASVFYNILYTLIITVLALIYYFVFSDFLNLKNTVFLVPIYILVFGFWLSITNLSIREKGFKVNSIAKIIQSVTNSFFSLVLGIINIPVGLVLGKSIGTSCSVYYLYNKYKTDSIYLTKKELNTISKEYIDFPKYTIIPAFLNAASTQAPVFFISYFFSESILGAYGFAVMAIAGPLSIIGVSFKDVFYQKISETYNKKLYKKLHSVFTKNVLFLLAIGLPLIVILFFFGDFIFGLLFGEKWIVAGRFTSILITSFVIKLVVSPLSVIFNVTKKLKLLSYWQILYFISSFITMGITLVYFEASINEFLITYVIHEVILYLIYFIIQYNIILKIKSQ